VVVLQLEVEVVLLLVLYMWIAWLQCYSSRCDLWEPDEQSNLVAVMAAQLASALARPLHWRAIGCADGTREHLE